MPPLVPDILRLLQAHPLVQSLCVVEHDETPHHPYISTEPHHFHDARGAVSESPLTGDPLTDLPVVLQEIEAFAGG